MGILIPGMEMPDSCVACRFGKETNYTGDFEEKCLVNDKCGYVSVRKPRLDTCPLVEVTEPSYIDAWCHDCSEYDNEHHCCHRWSHVIRKTVDELQLTHCKDCVYYDSDNKMCLDIIGFGRRWEETDYCSYGRRAE